MDITQPACRMTRAYAPSCAPLRTGHGCPALPLWAPRVMRALRSRMTAETARTGATQHGIATPRATPTQYDLKEKKR